MNKFCVLSQVDAAQTVLRGHSWQEPLPSHIPSLPQADIAVAVQLPWPLCGAAPALTVVHVPVEPGRLHAEQRPSQALSQQ